MIPVYVLVVPTWGRGVMLLIFLQGTEQSLTAKNYLTHSVNSAKVGELCLRGSLQGCLVVYKISLVVYSFIFQQFDYHVPKFHFLCFILFWDGF